MSGNLPPEMYLILLYALTLHRGIKSVSIRLIISKKANFQLYCIITGGNNYYGRRFQICFLKCRNTCVPELGRLEASGDRYKRSAGSHKEGSLQGME